jgi:hypothetical protein
MSQRSLVKQSRRMVFTKFRIGATLLTIAFLSSACASEQPPRGAATSTPKAGEASRSPSVTESPAIPADWASYENSELGLSFRYPRIPGTVETESGVYGSERDRFAWAVTRSDDCRDNVCRSYEFAALNDDCPPTEGWPTYAHEWYERGGRYYVNSCHGTDPFEVSPIRIVTRSDGLRGIIYDANVWLDPGRITGALAAVLNLPTGYHPNLEAIAFYFEDPTPTGDVELVIRSVRLSQISAS